MLRRTTARRGAFTLVELLVAVSVIIVLTSLAVLVIPDIMDQDRTTDGASLTRQWLMIAKARAARDQQPRGVRFIVDPNKPATQILLATEIQYTEAPILIPNRMGGWDYSTPTPAHPYVVVEYILAPNNPSGWPPLPSGTTPGTLVARRVTLGNLGAMEGDIGPGSYLSLDAWGIWLKLPNAFNINNHTNGDGVISFYVQQPPLGNYDLATFNMVVAQLDRHMGASQRALTYLSGVYASPRPLVGEKTQPLPKGICVDLASSSPAHTSTTTDYDIVFAPNGQILFRGEGQINLWVRDLTKNGGAGGSFPTGGEQQVVALKKSGALGVFPIAQGGNPFLFAQSAASAPSQ